MTTPRDPIYAGYRYPAEIISYAVWLYFRFPLSLRMVEEMLAARGISVTHETIRFRGGQGIDVRPHPHIDLATVTYLFEGEIIHCDSLGTMQPIRPGAVNWMTAGRGMIVNSERTSPEMKARGSRLFGLQTWVALPAANEETEPSSHYDATALPVLDAEGKQVRLVVDEAWGLRPPVKMLSATIYADVVLDPGAAVPLDASHEGHAVYVVSGAHARRFREVAQAAKGHGKAMGVGGVRQDFEFQSWLLRLGVRYLTGGSDIGYILSAGRADVKQLRELKLQEGRTLRLGF